MDRRPARTLKRCGRCSIAKRHHAARFIHNGPRPGDTYPKVAADTDNARRRNGTLDMQASLSSVMMTLSLTDLLADYPDATIQVTTSAATFPLRSSAWTTAACSTPRMKSCRRHASAGRRSMWTAPSGPRSRATRLTDKAPSVAMTNPADWLGSSGYCSFILYAGAGATILSERVCSDAIRAGTLKRLPISAAPRGFYGVRHADRYRSRAVSALLEILRKPAA
jgi:hypothetical protein